MFLRSLLSFLLQFSSFDLHLFPLSFFPSSSLSSSSSSRIRASVQQLAALEQQVLDVTRRLSAEEGRRRDAEEHLARAQAEVTVTLAPLLPFMMTIKEIRRERDRDRDREIEIER
jgi:hypothetical protein